MRGICFRVTNAHGEGVSAALGLQIVDEAVFALAEKQPGFAKTFFYLEQEVMKPRYEIHSLSCRAPSNPWKTAAAISRTRRPVLFSRQPRWLDQRSSTRSLAAVCRRTSTLNTSSATGPFSSTRSAISQPNSVKRYGRLGSTQDIPSMFNSARPRDSWNTPLRIEPATWSEAEAPRLPRAQCGSGWRI